MVEYAFRKKGRPFHTVIYRTDCTTILLWEHGAGAPKEVHPNEMDFKLGPVPVVY